MGIDTIGDKSFDVVYAFGEEVERGKVNMTFSTEESVRRMTLSGECDFSGELSSENKMDVSLNGRYENCPSPRVKDALDHWKNNKDVNKAQLYLMYVNAFESRWVMFGDKDHQANRIRLMVGQHFLDHPKFLNKEYDNHVEKYGNGVPEALP